MLREFDPIHIRHGERLAIRLRPALQHYIRYLPFPLTAIAISDFCGMESILLPLSLFLFFVILSRYSHLFIITSHRVVEKKGLIARYTYEIDFSKIHLIKLEQGIIDRLLGTGSLVIESAGHNPGRGDVVFGEIANPLKIKEFIFRLKNRKNLNQKYRNRIY